MSVERIDSLAVDYRAGGEFDRANSCANLAEAVRHGYISALAGLGRTDTLPEDAARELEQRAIMFEGSTCVYGGPEFLPEYMR